MISLLKINWNTIDRIHRKIRKPKHINNNELINYLRIKYQSILLGKCVNIWNNDAYNIKIAFNTDDNFIKQIN